MKQKLGTEFRPKVRFIALRTLLILSTALLLLPPGFKGYFLSFPTLVISFFLLSNFVWMVLPAKRLFDPRFQFLTIVLDTFLVAMGLFQAGPGRPDLAVSFFVVLLLCTFGRDLFGIAVGTTVVAGLYLFLSQQGGLMEGIPAVQAFLQIPFLYVSGLYYGEAVVKVRVEQDQAARLAEEREDLQTLLKITEATTSCLDLSEVLRTITQKVALMVDAVRCSIVLLKGPDNQCVVMASSDDPEMKPLTLQLEKYPELRKAIETRETVIINDITKEAMMLDYQEILKKRNFRSILVIPLMFQEEILGLLFIRAAKSDQKFSLKEIQASKVIANASANALKNGILFEKMREEMKRRKETSEILRNLMESSPDLIFLTDPEGILTGISRRGAELLGVSRDQVIGTPANKLFFGTGIPISLESLGKRGGTVTNHQILLKQANGDLRHGIASISILQDEEGQPNGMVGICKDLTELKQAQKKLQQAQNNSTIGKILNMVNSIKDPLSGVVGYSQLLMRNNPDPKTERGAKRILDASMKCRRVIEKLMSFSQKYTLEQEYLGVNQILEQALKRKRKDLADHGISVHLDLPPDLPNAMLDPEKMQQVILNLIENSEQAILSTGRKGNLSIRGYHRDHQLVFEFEDDGPGIPYQNMEKIFEPYFTTRGTGTGTGLGLWASHCIVKAHGGKIFARRGKKEGACFTIELPVRSSGGQETGTVQPFAGKMVSPMRILAVDDEQVVLDLLVDYLKLYGHRVDIAKTGKAALEMVEKYPYDAILLDIRLPDLSGTEVFQRIEKHHPALAKKVIFNSVDTYQPKIRDFIRKSGNRSIQKPFKLDDLQVALSSIGGTAA